MNGTSFLLGAGYPWPADPGAKAKGMVTGARTGMALASLPAGPLGLASEDDSLGQLTLPRGVAVDGDAVFVLAHDGAMVYRYDPLRQTLAPLPHIGAEGLGSESADPVFAEPRRFRHASAIAALRGELYVADPLARRVQVFDTASLALLRIHAGIGNPGAPTDLASGPDAVYLLDRAAGRVYRAMPGRDALVLAIQPGAGIDRIAVDAGGRVYLRRGQGNALELLAYEVKGKLPLTEPSLRIADGAEVRDRFVQPPPVTMDASGVLTLAGHLLDPCGLRVALPANAARWRVGGRLYAADPVTMSLRVYLADGRLRQEFGPFDASGGAVARDSALAWWPADVTALDGAVVVLDARHQRVYAHLAEGGALRQWFGAPAGRTWRRIAADGAGCLLLWDGSGDVVERWSPRGEDLGRVALRAVRARFDSPAAAVPHRPGVALTRCGARPHHAPAPPSWPQARFEQSGIWTSAWLDSDTYDCSWHKIELSLARLPPGSSIQLRTRTSNQAPDQLRPPRRADDHAPGLWRESPTLAAPAQPAPDAAPGVDSDLLVLSAPGRYLQLQVELRGNGIDTPQLDHLRIHLPRESLLDYLPAIYSSPPDQREFLDRLLSIAQTSWGKIEHDLDTFERHLDPDSVLPDEMPYLAEWLDVRLEGTWNPEQNRRLLQAMPRLRNQWGTLDGMRGWLRVYLANLGNLDEPDLERLGWPGIVESFVERRRLMLGAGGAQLGAAEPLWGPAVERRFQLGVYQRLGEVELVSTGDPASDPLRHYAHSFRVYVPAQLVRTPDREALLRRAIEAQKPVHTAYQLVLVEPRLRIGVQSTIGLDTIIGDAHPLPLPCPAIPDAPSRQPYARLGFDTTLGPGGEAERQARLNRVLP